MIDAFGGFDLDDNRYIIAVIFFYCGAIDCFDKKIKIIYN